MPSHSRSKNQSTTSTTSAVTPATTTTTSNSAVASTMPGTTPATSTPTLAAAGADQGRTGGAVSLDDFAQAETGGGASTLDVAGARTKGAEFDAKSLADWEAEFQAANAARAAGTPKDSRSTADMLAAIAANTAPKYLARVGPKDNFVRHGAFGKGWSEFIFATEPADLMGCSAIEAMVKVGWPKDAIEGVAGQPIAVCILDTSKSVPTKSGGGDANVTTGKFEWPELTAKATSDSTFVKGFKDAAIAATSPLVTTTTSDADAVALLTQLLGVWSQTPVGGTPSTSSPDHAQLAGIVRGLLNANYGANELYSGMGATISESGDLGAREVMVNNNDTGFVLTTDNHSIVELGSFTKADVGTALAPPPPSP
ncbi:MAG: hypothetical protein AB8H79_18925 [Myxococcota bacterium]